MSLIARESPGNSTAVLCALLLVSACAHQDKASNATQAGATAAAPAGTVASSQPDPSQSLKDQIGTVIGQMDRDQNAAQQEQDDYNRALQDPTLAFSDATSAAVARAAADASRTLPYWNGRFCMEASPAWARCWMQARIPRCAA